MLWFYFVENSNGLSELFSFSMKHENGSKITALNWSPSEKGELVYADDQVCNASLLLLIVRFPSLM